MRPSIPALVPVLVGGLLLATVGAASAQTLRGSRVAMQRQNSVARDLDYSFLETSGQVRRFADLGLLVPVKSTSHVRLTGVSHPYARPAVKVLVERLGQQYHAACGERLVVTSLTRPMSEQPRNASDLSVHPAGMAVDLRISKKRSCQRWLEKTLLSLEDRGVLDATKEKRPPHFHVAVFPERYLAYVEKLGGGKAVKVASTAGSKPKTSTAGKDVVIRASNPGKSTSPGARVAAAEPEETTGGAQATTIEKYRVNRGDTLWTIARRYGTTVAELKAVNKLRTSRIAAGQVITIPAGSAAP